MCPGLGLLADPVASLVSQRVKHLLTMWETQVWSLGWDDSLEKEMATHSSILAWKIPWMEKPGGLQSVGSQIVRHDWAISLSFFMASLVVSGKESTCQCRTCKFDPWIGMILWRRKWQPTPIFLPGKSQGLRSPVDCSLWVAKEIHCPCDNKLHPPDLRDLKEFLLLGWGWGAGRGGSK